ncbi:MAG: peptidylprolyl isomerase [Oscillospiraceae bacterium]|nr:peptidylprolyl isomerase [Oscillospiraceae bacterium]
MPVIDKKNRKKISIKKVISAIPKPPIPKKLALAITAAVVVIGVIALILLLRGPSDEPVLLTVGSRNIVETEARYYLLSAARAVRERFPHADWEDIVRGVPLSELIRHEALSSIKSDYAIRMKAAELDTELTSEQMTGLDRILSDRIGYFGGARAFSDFLTQQGMNIDLFTHLNEITVLRANILDVLFGEDGTIPVMRWQLVAFAEEQGYIRTTHILRTTQDEHGERLMEADVQRQRAIAEYILPRATAGEDFFILLAEFGEDPGVMHPPHYYDFQRGTMDEEFEAAAFELFDYEISGIVETAFGYHIIKRLPIDPEAVRGAHANFELNKILVEWASEVEHSLSERWQNVNIRALYENFR